MLLVSGFSYSDIDRFFFANIGEISHKTHLLGTSIIIQKDNKMYKPRHLSISYFWRKSIKVNLSAVILVDIFQTTRY